MPRWTLREQHTVALLLLLAGAGFGFGIWAQYPLLRAGFDRLPGWQLALISVADVAGLVLFLRGALRFPGANAALRNPADREYQKKVLRLYLLAFGTPWLVDLGASLALRSPVLSVTSSQQPNTERVKPFCMCANLVPFRGAQGRLPHGKTRTLECVKLSWPLAARSQMARANNCSANSRYLWGLGGSDRTASIS